MLSGIKFIPKDQLISTNSGSENGLKKSKEEKKDRRKNSGSENGLKKSKEEKKDRRKKEKKKRREYSSDSDEESDSLDSRSDSAGERRSKKKRKGRKKEKYLEESSDSDEYAKRRGKKDKKGVSDQGDGNLLQRNVELVRKEMGLGWMLNPGSKSANNTVRDNSRPEEPQVEEMKNANPRELNPYLKDDGSGYPDDASPSDAVAGKLLSSSVVGDGGASWRLKALKRAKEQAAREGRKLDEVVEERWGSLGQLATSISTRRVAPTHAHLHAIKDRRKGQLEISESGAASEEVQHTPRDYLRDVSSLHPEMRRPKKDVLHWKKKRNNISSEDSSLVASAISSINKFADDGSYMEAIAHLQNKDVDVSNSSQASIEENVPRENDTGTFSNRNPVTISSADIHGLSKNQLAAKVLQLRMKGKHAEAEQLSKKMESMIDPPNMEKEIDRLEADNITSRYIEKKISSDQKKKEADADMHLAKKIMRNKQYSISGRADDEYDYDGDVPSKKSNRKRGELREEKRNIPKRILTQQERCLFCFENPSRPKHLVVSIGNLTYMVLPPMQPVVQGHCCILPMQHDSATRSVDKNVWEEIRNFKKCLLRMFAEQEKDVLFIETVIGLSRHRRHCLIECIPVPRAIAKQAPLYFKKAIDEAEDEWGQHEMKKVIPTSGNLRNVIPENMAYFHVEFGLDKGFVHIIDDDSNFSSGFGLNVVRGMLQLPEEDMHRRRRQEPIEIQKQAVASFAKEWKRFDWTKDLE